jgi:hypothetical protein
MTASLTWVTLRQQRTVLLAALGLLAAFLLVAVLEAHDVRFVGLSAASPSRALAAYLPAVLGAFWGAPLLARELESGTIELLWSQSVTRARWLALTLGLVFALTVAVALAVVAILPRVLEPRFPLHYTYPVTSAGAVGHAVFAVALGVLVGAVIGRVEPAMGLTLVGYGLIRLAVAWLELRLVPLKRVAVPTERAYGWGRDVIVYKLKYRQYDALITYRSHAQLAKLQWVELGVFCGLAALLLAAAFAVVARRSSRP